MILFILLGIGIFLICMYELKKIVKEIDDKKCH